MNFTNSVKLKFSDLLQFEWIFVTSWSNILKVLFHWVNLIFQMLPHFVILYPKPHSLISPSIKSEIFLIIGSWQVHNGRNKHYKILSFAWKLKFYHWLHCQLFSLKTDSIFQANAKSSSMNIMVHHLFFQVKTELHTKSTSLAHKSTRWALHKTTILLSSSLMCTFHFITTYLKDKLKGQES